MQRHTPFQSGEHYHIYNRGVNKEKIFYSDGDWNYFQRLLYVRNDAEGHIRPGRNQGTLLSEIGIEKPLVNIQAYALMPNHFHLLVSEREPGGISTFMKRLLTSYSMYMNKKYDRSGPLMCRPFRSKHVDSEDYLRWVISYIHLNPLDLKMPKWREKGIRDQGAAAHQVRNYPYSSFTDYFGPARDESVILNKESLPIFISELEDLGNMLKLQSTHLV
jgi:putative transposase